MICTEETSTPAHANASKASRGKSPYNFFTSISLHAKNTIVIIYRQNCFAVKYKPCFELRSIFNTNTFAW